MSSSSDFNPLHSDSDCDSSNHQDPSNCEINETSGIETSETNDFTLKESSSLASKEDSSLDEKEEEVCEPSIADSTSP